MKEDGGQMVDLWWFTHDLRDQKSVWKFSKGGKCVSEFNHLKYLLRCSSAALIDETLSVVNPAKPALNVNTVNVCFLFCLLKKKTMCFFSICWLLNMKAVFTGVHFLSSTFVLQQLNRCCTCVCVCGGLTEATVTPLECPISPPLSPWQRRQCSQTGLPEQGRSGCIAGWATQTRQFCGPTIRPLWFHFPGEPDRCGSESRAASRPGSGLRWEPGHTKTAQLGYSYAGPKQQRVCVWFKNSTGSINRQVLSYYTGEMYIVVNGLQLVWPPTHTTARKNNEQV